MKNEIPCDFQPDSRCPFEAVKFYKIKTRRIITIVARCNHHKLDYIINNETDLTKEEYLLAIVHEE